jgi:hypothetical protein
MIAEPRLTKWLRVFYAKLRLWIQMINVVSPEPPAALHLYQTIGLYAVERLWIECWADFHSVGGRAPAVAKNFRRNNPNALCGPRAQPRNLISPYFGPLERSRGLVGFGGGCAVLYDQVGELKRRNATTSSPFRRISAYTSSHQQIEIQLEDELKDFLQDTVTWIYVCSHFPFATLPRESTSFPMRQLLSQRHSLLLSRSTCICKDCLPPPCIGTPAHRRLNVEQWTGKCFRDDEVHFWLSSVISNCCYQWIWNGMMSRSPRTSVVGSFIWNYFHVSVYIYFQFRQISILT